MITESVEVSDNHVRLITLYFFFNKSALHTRARFSCFMSVSDGMLVRRSRGITTLRCKGSNNFSFHQIIGQKSAGKDKQQTNGKWTMEKSCDGSAAQWTKTNGTNRTEMTYNAKRTVILTPLRPHPPMRRRRVTMTGLPSASSIGLPSASICGMIGSS